MKILLFYNGPFSQWFPSPFIVDGASYNCAEQYMMARKAAMFGDGNSWKFIMDTDDPSEQKARGRRILKYDDNIWNDARYGVVLKGNMAKFSQNVQLRHYLLKTDNILIAEASPTDIIWGIGLDEYDPRAQNLKLWRGQNLLGRVLMDVRTELRR